MTIEFGGGLHRGNRRRPDRSAVSGFQVQISSDAGLAHGRQQDLHRLGGDGPGFLDPDNVRAFKRTNAFDVAFQTDEQEIGSACRCGSMDRSVTVN